MADPNTALAMGGTAAVLGLPAVKKTIDFAERLLGEPIDEFGRGLAEIGRRFRLVNQVKTLELARQLASERGLEISEIDPSFAHEWLEGAGSTAEEEMQTLWAELLMSASVNNRAACKKRYINALRQMTYDDAQLLKYAVAFSDSILPPSVEDDGALDETVANLYRLGVLSPCWTTCDQARREPRDNTKGLMTDGVRIRVGPFGRNFAMAVGLSPAGMRHSES